MLQLGPDRPQVVVFESLRAEICVEFERLLEKGQRLIGMPETAFVAGEVVGDDGDFRKALPGFKQDAACGFDALRPPDGVRELNVEGGFAGPPRDQGPGELRGVAPSAIRHRQVQFSFDEWIALAVGRIDLLQLLPGFVDHLQVDKSLASLQAPNDVFWESSLH